MAEASPHGRACSVSSEATHGSSCGTLSSYFCSDTTPALYEFTLIPRDPTPGTPRIRKPIQPAIRQHNRLHAPGGALAGGNRGINGIATARQKGGGSQRNK